MNLESRAEELIITTYGGEGSLYITADGEVDYGDFFGFDEFDESEFFEEDMFGEEFISYGEGTNQDLYIFSPAAGRFDITIVAQDDFSDVSIVAFWNENKRPEPEPPVVVDSEEIYACDYNLEEFFEEIDINGNGLMNADEFRRSDPPSDIEFTDVDVNKDGMIEFTEVVAFSCTCENELNSMMDQLPFKTSTEFFESLDLRNTYDLKFLDENGDDYITQDELEEAIENCKTTFNPFDTDGDGVPNVDDQFPNDPSESKDADGDGIGDNADFAPSVANDMLYGAGGAILIVLIGLLVLFARGGGGSRQILEQEWNKTDAFSEQMLNMGDNLAEAPPIGRQALQSSIVNEVAPPRQTTSLPVYDFGEDNFEPQPEHDQPAASLMGMMDSNGREHIEYPPNSGRLWYRDNPDSAWIND